jgi:zinc transporter, ZIP family
MDEFFLTLGLAAVSIIGVLLGVVLAESFDISKLKLSLALHLAGGAVFAVVGVELMPRALEIDPPWIMVLAFLLGGLFFIAAERAIQAIQRWRGKGSGGEGSWMIFFGVGMDYVTDGIMIGTGATISFGLGLVLALGQAVANAPGAFVTIAELKNQKKQRRTRLLCALLFVLLILSGAAIGHWVMQEQSENLQLSVLAFTAGILTLVVVEEMGPRADDHGDLRSAPLAVLVGFAVFTLIATYFG